MKKILAALAVFCVLFAGYAFAAVEEFTFPDGKVDLVCPDGWKHEMTDEAIRMASPDEAVQFVFEVLDVKDLEAGLEKAKAEIDKAIGATTFGEPVEEKINEMPAITFEGTCAEKGLEVMVSIIITPAENALCVYYFAAKAAEEKHAAGIAEVIKGIKPAAPEAVAPAAALTETEETEDTEETEGTEEETAGDEE